MNLELEAELFRSSQVFLILECVIANGASNWTMHIADTDDDSQIQEGWSNSQGIQSEVDDTGEDSQNQTLG